MELVERGALDLDAPVTRFLPDFRPGNKFDKDITLRMLMSHRAGLVREPPLGHYFDDTVPSLERTVESLNRTDLVYEPGTKTKYSNAGIAAVGFAVEKTQKQRFERDLYNHILDPLGMKRSSFEPLDELNKLMDHFSMVEARRNGVLPMTRIVPFAIFSTRRQEEIVTIRWKDFDKDRILVRDMKHPGDKTGNNVWCDLTPEAVAYIKVMPKVSERIFPFTTDAISAAFTRACKVLGIEDLHFHDLRHDGVSRLFEMGRTIPQAMGQRHPRHGDVVECDR